MAIVSFARNLIRSHLQPVADLVHGQQPVFPADAFARYLHLSEQGGEKLWTDLLTEAGFRSPFEPGALVQLAAQVEPLIRRQNI